MNIPSPIVDHTPLTHEEIRLLRRIGEEYPDSVFRVSFVTDLINVSEIRGGNLMKSLFRKDMIKNPFVDTDSIGRDDIVALSARGKGYLVKNNPQ